MFTKLMLVATLAALTPVQADIPLPEGVPIPRPGHAICHEDGTYCILRADEYREMVRRANDNTKRCGELYVEPKKRAVNWKSA